MSKTKVEQEPAEVVVRRTAGRVLQWDGGLPKVVPRGSLARGTPEAMAELVVTGEYVGEGWTPAPAELVAAAERVIARLDGDRRRVGWAVAPWVEAHKRVYESVVGYLGGQE
jgi:hypothetical protein